MLTYLPRGGSQALAPEATPNNPVAREKNSISSASTVGFEEGMRGLTATYVSKRDA